MSVPSATLASSPITFAYVATNIATAAWAFPSNRALTQFAFPGSNTRQVVILNTGSNPLLFGLKVFTAQSQLPSATVLGSGVPFAFPAASYPLAASAGFAVVEGDNCTRIPIGGSLSIDLLPYQERGNFSPIPGTPLNTSLQATAYPLYLLFFGATGVGADTTADITYVNKLGAF
jgi:hypothetical protein